VRNVIHDMSIIHVPVLLPPTFDHFNTFIDLPVSGVL